MSPRKTAESTGDLLRTALDRIQERVERSAVKTEQLSEMLGVVIKVLDDEDGEAYTPGALIILEAVQRDLEDELKSDLNGTAQDAIQAKQAGGAR